MMGRKKFKEGERAGWRFLHRWKGMRMCVCVCEEDVVYVVEK